MVLRLIFMKNPSHCDADWIGVENWPVLYAEWTFWSAFLDSSVNIWGSNIQWSIFAGEILWFERKFLVKWFSTKLDPMLRINLFEEIIWHDQWPLASADAGQFGPRVNIVRKVERLGLFYSAHQSKYRHCSTSLWKSSYCIAHIWTSELHWMHVPLLLPTTISKCPTKRIFKHPQSGLLQDYYCLNLLFMHYASITGNLNARHWILARIFFQRNIAGHWAGMSIDSFNWWYDLKPT